MAGISKRTRGSWVSSDYGVMKTATDTITTLPAVIYPNDTTATVGLKGNMSQTGTPTPTTPIQPSECGERTGNLFDKDNAPSVGWYCGSDNIIRSSTAIKATYIPCSPNATYTIAKIQSARFKVAWTVNEPALGVTYYDLVNVTGTSVTITTGSTASYLYVEYYTSSSDTYTEAEIRNTIMLNTGSTPLPYEPYGYKIPISSANTTTPVYLGEIESTRRIRKLVLTGDETWSATTDSVYIDKTNFSGEPTLGNTPLYCSHYPNDNTGMIMGNSWWFRCYDTNSLQNWKTYLAQQYAAGTPVTVWYVLAEPETTVVNEPLMKIGNYADEVSGITIPVTAGGDTISVDTTVQPSEITVNYKGWHPTIVHERANGAWT